MAIDKKIKSEVTKMMKILRIDHDEWLSELYKKFIDENKEECFDKALEAQNSTLCTKCRNIIDVTEEISLE